MALEGCIRVAADERKTHFCHGTRPRLDAREDPTKIPRNLLPRDNVRCTRRDCGASRRKEKGAPDDSEVRLEVAAKASATPLAAVIHFEWHKFQGRNLRRRWSRELLSTLPM